MAKVYFSKEITPEALVKIYDALPAGFVSVFAGIVVSGAFAKRLTGVSPILSVMPDKISHFHFCQLFIFYFPN